MEARTGTRSLPIVQYWHSAEIPPEIAELATSFRVRNPGARYLMFDEGEATRLIDEHFSEREVAAFRACAVPSMQGDYFSYCASLVLGGVYSDVGFRNQCSLRSLIAETERATLFQIDESGVIIHGFFAVSAPGNPLMRLALEVATENIERRVAEAVNMVTGPYIFNGLVKLYCAGTLDPSPGYLANPHAGAILPSFQDAIGGFSRLAAAFEGVRIVPLSQAQWIARPPHPLAYKHSDLDWVKWCRRGETIFR